MESSSECSDAGGKREWRSGERSRELERRRRDENERGRRRDVVKWGGGTRRGERSRTEESRSRSTTRGSECESLDTGRGDERRCYRCRGRGHIAKDCAEVVPLRGSNRLPRREYDEMAPRRVIVAGQKASEGLEGSGTDGMAGKVRVIGEERVLEVHEGVGEMTEGDLDRAKKDLEWSKQRVKEQERELERRRAMIERRARERKERKEREQQMANLEEERMRIKQREEELQKELDGISGGLSGDDEGCEAVKVIQETETRDEIITVREQEKKGDPQETEEEKTEQEKEVKLTNLKIQLKGKVRETEPKKPGLKGQQEKGKRKREQGGAHEKAGEKEIPGKEQDKLPTGPVAAKLNRDQKEDRQRERKERGKGTKARAPLEPQEKGKGRKEEPLEVKAKSGEKGKTGKGSEAEKLKREDGVDDVEVREPSGSDGKGRLRDGERASKKSKVAGKEDVIVVDERKGKVQVGTEGESSSESGENRRVLASAIMREVGWPGSVAVGLRMLPEGSHFYTEGPAILLTLRGASMCLEPERRTEITHGEGTAARDDGKGMEVREQAGVRDEEEPGKSGNGKGSKSKK